MLEQIICWMAFVVFGMELAFVFFLCLLALREVTGDVWAWVRRRV